MTEFRVTKVLCPSCKGSGKFMAEKFDCFWCGGAKRLGKTSALRYADQQWMIAGGGYIAGDHEIEDARKMEAQSIRIAKLFDDPRRYDRKGNAP